MRNTLPKVYGITGGIGSGKSTVAGVFAHYGIPCLDADQVARKLREPGQLGHTQIQSRFGTTDRVELRALITKDPEAKKALEAILHPLIKQESDLLLVSMAENYPNAPALLYEATLLIEAGRATDFAGTMVVIAPIDLRIERIMKRDHCTKEVALAMIQAQMSDEERLKHANFVIANDGSLENLKLEVKRVLDEIRLPRPKSS